jgi:hypothetical protein
VNQSKRRAAATVLMACVVLAFAGCSPKPSAPSGGPSGVSVRAPATSTAPVNLEATLPTANLGGLVVSLETSTKPLSWGATVPKIKPRTSYRLLSIRMVARNSTDATMTGVRLFRNMPQVTDNSGRRVDFVQSGIGGSGVGDIYGYGPTFVASPGHPLPPQRPEGFSPRGELTATIMCQLAVKRTYTVTWRFSPDRIAVFELP